MRLETARIVIRSIQPGDGDAWVSMLSDPRVRRFLPPFPEVTLESFDDVIERRRKREHELGYTIWAVALKQTDEMIGQCGLLPAEARDPKSKLPIISPRRLGTKATQLKPLLPSSNTHSNPLNSIASLRSSCRRISHRNA